MYLNSGRVTRAVNAKQCCYIVRYRFRGYSGVDTESFLGSLAGFFPVTGVSVYLYQQHILLIYIRSFSFEQDFTRSKVDGFQASEM